MKHYKQQPIETIDMMLSIYGSDKVKTFCEINAFKYRMRAGYKDNAAQDIEKALWYEEKAKTLNQTDLQPDHLHSFMRHRINEFVKKLNRDLPVVVDYCYPGELGTLFDIVVPRTENTSSILKINKVEEMNDDNVNHLQNHILQILQKEI